MLPSSRVLLGDAQLIPSAKRGDVRALQTLYQMHHPKILRLSLRLTNDYDLAHEFAQETFIRAFERLHTFQGAAAFSTWLHRIALHTIANGMKREGRARARQLAYAREAPTAGAAATGDVVLRDRLTRAVADLPNRQRTVLVLHDVEGYSHGEIAAMLGVRDVTSRTTLAMARTALRADLRRCAPRD